MGDERKKNEFRRLFQAVEPDLFRYLVIMVAHDADARDLLQETAGALWEQFDRYDRARPFGPWARKFAYMEVLKFRLYRAREGAKRVFLSQSSIEALSSEYTAHEGVLELRKSALALCIGKLPAEDRQLIEQHYWEKKKLRALAEDQQVSEDRIFRQMQRIRLLLQECIERALAEGGAP